MDWEEIIVRGLRLGLIILSEVMRYAPPPRIEARLEGGLAHSLPREQADRFSVPPATEVAGGHSGAHPVGVEHGPTKGENNQEDHQVQSPASTQERRKEGEGEEGKEEEVESSHECPLCRRFGPICDSLGERSASCWALVSLLADGLLSPDEFSEKLMVLLESENKVELAKKLLGEGENESINQSTG